MIYNYYEIPVTAIEFITTTMQKTDDDVTVADEWKFIAIIIDRFIMYFY